MSEIKISNNTRIAKNTLYLYIRMGVTMIVQLYTSRVVLNTLGIEDYGIWSIVASFVVAFTFISGPLNSATQRFLSFSIGKNDKSETANIFSMSLNVYLILSLIIIIIVESFGLWFLNSKMDLPYDRIIAANWVFHISLIMLVVGIIQTPYSAVIIANEKMSFYALISIIEISTKLLIVYLIVNSQFDKLKVYAILSLAATILVFICYYIYSRKMFSCTKYSLFWDSKLFKSLLSFSGWSLFGSVSTMTSTQGLNILLNLFYGVTVNAAMGIANQVNTSVNQFVVNFQVAFQPQIIKSFASGNTDYLNSLINYTAKYSFLLLFAILCPVIFNIDYLLVLWLIDVPIWTAEFCSLMLVSSLIDSISSPLWMTIQATGEIKNYQVVISIIILSTIVFSYILLSLNFEPIIVMEVKVIVSVVSLFARLLFVKSKIGFSIINFAKDILSKLFIVSVVLIVLLFCLRYFLILSNLSYLLISISIFFPIYFVLIYFIVLNNTEKSYLKSIFFSMLK